MKIIILGSGPGWARCTLNDYIDQLEIGGEIYPPEDDLDRPAQTTARLDPPFLWLTHSGELLGLDEMATPHLYYALRMIFNHSVPAEFQTPESLHPIKRYKDVPHWTPGYRKAAIDALSAELRTRNPKGLTLAMQDGLRWMDMAARAILNEGI